MRERLSLDGTWDINFEPAGDDDAWRAVQVPGAWQAQFEYWRERAAAARYRLRFDCPADWAGSAACLHFGAVDYAAEVWLNGQRLGEHEGGYLPFEFEAGPWLRPGHFNELLVSVVDPTDDAGRFPGTPFSEIPHGKQSWYGHVGGLWQSVWLERRAAQHVRAVYVTAEPAAGRVVVRLALAGPAAAGLAAHLRVLGPAPEVAAEGELVLAAGAGEAQSVLAVPEPLWWSPEHPHLYTLEVTLLDNGQAGDSLRQTFGFRTIEARDGALVLNGQRLYLRGALDQDYYPGTFYTPPSAEFIEQQFRQAKHLGLNCLRCHIKAADPAYLEAADRLGLLIWAELPNWRHFGPATGARGRDTLAGMLARDGHHPSVIAWTIINEGWGLDLAIDERHRAWLKDTYHWLKALDPTRLVIDNSACEPNFHLQTDLDDFHYYAGLPDHRQRWDRFVEAYAGRPAWTFSPHGDAVRTGLEPLIVSEFGNWGLPDVAGLMRPDGREPWWFETGLEWGDGAVYPHGVQRRARLWGLERIFGSYAALATATQWQQFAALKYEIETMRRQPAITGYVITEFTDVHWECNGLLDFERHPKAFHDVFARINAGTVILPRWKRAAYWAGEAITVSLSVAHAGAAGALPAGARLGWRLGEARGELLLPEVPAGQVAEAGQARVRAPAVDGPCQASLELELRSPDGALLAANELSLSLFPPQAKPPSSVPLWSGEARLAKYLAALGYPLAARAGDARVIVTRRLSAPQLAAAQAGARVVLLADTAGALGPGLPRLRLQARHGTIWDGDWASSFAWVRRDGPWAALPGGPLLDFGFDHVIPDLVIQGLSPDDFQQRVPAGLFVGWVHKPVGLIAAQPYGRGLVVICAFRLLRDAPGADPVAATLLAGLIQMALADY